MNSLSIKATPVINELMNSLSIKASIIRIVLPIAADWLISFHVNVNSLLPLPSVHPPMPPLLYTLQWTPWALGWFVMCLLGLQFFLPWLKWYIYIYIYIYILRRIYSLDIPLWYAWSLRKGRQLTHAKAVLHWFCGFPAEFWVFEAFTFIFFLQFTSADDDAADL